MKAGQRAALMVLLMIGAGSAASQPAFVPPLENPPNYRQIIKSLMRPEPPKSPNSAAAADAKANKKPDPTAAAKPKAATPATKPDAAAETKPKPRRLVDRAEHDGRITRIAPGMSWEISKPRRVDVVPGRSWQVCLKGKQNDKPFYLALFIQGRDVADARTSVQIDRCESENYEPL